VSAARALYLDTSALLRAALEAGVTPDLERRLAAASTLITSRVTLVEAARAFLRLRQLGRVAAAPLADAEREVAAVLQRCDLWELTRAVCDEAGPVAPRLGLRTPDALHLATFLLARRRLDGLELLTADERRRAAAAGA
jgi:predicted nucleic acid-binding protein